MNPAFQTRCVHGGGVQDGPFHAVTTPIYQTSTFFFEGLGIGSGYDYTRTSNPTRRALEKNLAQLEGGADAVVTATGMAAVLNAALLLKAGDHLIAGHDIYGGTYRLFEHVLPKIGIAVSFVDQRDPANVKAAIAENTRGLWIETPSNPLLNIVDISELASIGHEKGLLIFADNTFLSPYFQKPLELGADVVIQSTTKYLNGHCDVVGGAVISSTKELHQQISFLHNCLGLGASPFDSWLVLRGVKTLPQRMEVHAANADALARWLSSHQKVTKVYYPGMEDHPGHDVARRQQSGFGGMVSFEVAGGFESAKAVLENVRIFVLAESLGGIGSLIEHPDTMSHASMSEEARRQAGIAPGLIRISVGIENVQDLIADLDQALRIGVRPQITK
jgi:O-succinylhomoserine (thiol)-lyase